MNGFQILLKPLETRSRRSQRWEESEAPRGLHLETATQHADTSSDGDSETIAVDNNVRRGRSTERCLRRTGGETSEGGTP
jgi:hypothetical protein